MGGCLSWKVTSLQSLQAVDIVVSGYLMFLVFKKDDSACLLKPAFTVYV